jgi:hypothetical protein
MSLVRVGLAENEEFAAGYDAIFGKKKSVEATSPAPSPANSDASVEANTQDTTEQA